MGSKLLKNPIFVRDTETQSLLSSFVISLENLQRKVNWKWVCNSSILLKKFEEKLERVTSTLRKRKWTFPPTSDNNQDSAKRHREREMDELRRRYLREIKLSINEIWECQWKHHLRENDEIKSFFKSTFLLESEHWISKNNAVSNIRSVEMFGYVQCKIRVPDKLKKIEASPSIFKNALVSRSDIGEFVKKNAGENKMLTQPRKMLKSCFQVIHVTIITPFSYFHLDFELECTQMYRFVHYTPWKCFKGFVQHAVNARRGD